MDIHEHTHDKDEGLIPKHGGYRKLKTFQIAEVIYDVTVKFCGKYLDNRSRTVDQMVQAARSGRQNIAEGSMDSGTSKKIELKLTGIAKGSLEELKLDYEDYLRQHGFPKWAPNHPALLRFKKLRCTNLEEFRQWVARETQLEKEEHGQTRTNTDRHGDTGADTKRRGHPRTNTNKHEPTRTGDNKHQHEQTNNTVHERLCSSVYVANGALSLLNLCTYLLDRQMKAQAAAFEKEGGFTERLYRKRSESRKRNPE